MATIRDYFETDFRSDIVSSNTFEFAWNPDGRLISVDARLHFDFDASAVFVSFYMARLPNPPVFIRDICVHVERMILKLRKGPQFNASKEGEAQARAEDLKFAGRVFVYAEDDLKPDQVTEITELWRRQDIYFRFRKPAATRKVTMYPASGSCQLRRLRRTNLFFR